MAENPIEVIQIDERTRYALYPDFTSYSLGEVAHDGVEIQGVDIPRSDWHTDVYARFYGTFLYRRNAEALTNRAFSLWLTLNGVANRVFDLRGYSQGEYAQVVVYVRPWVANADEDGVSDEGWTWYERVANAWFAGGVYAWACERLWTYTAEDGDTIDRWRDLDEDEAGRVWGQTDDFTRQACDEMFGHLFSSVANA
jgi:hypothetical protein